MNISHIQNTKSNLAFRKLISTFFVSLFIITFSFSSLQMSAKEKNMERIKTMKKIRLLEVLDLDAAASDKFLAKYNEYEGKHEKKMEEIRAQLKELRGMLEDNNKTNPAIKDKVNNLTKLQGEFHNSILERDKEMKMVLDEYTYAKYLVFEMGFKDKVMEKMMEMREKNGGREGKKNKGKGWDD
jgi:Skp family chaperone for outer membrane proteins